MFQNALRHYLKLQGDSNPSLKKEWVAQAFSHFGGKKPPKSFDELTFAEYTAVLLHKSRWSAYGSLFDLDSRAIQKLLDEVRTTRNDLAHFRGEISPRQRDQLRFCVEWLAYHQPAFPVVLPVPDRSEQEHLVAREPQMSYMAVPLIETAIAPTDEVLGPDESRYAPLALWLRSQPIAQDRLTLSFDQIEEILGNKLPESARQHRSWWANDSVGHVQSQQWLEVGWRVSYINMGEGRITFARIKDREKAYIGFFSSLLPMLHIAQKFAAKTPSPDGQSWVNVAWLPDDKQQVPLAYSFARGRRFRIELYIDVGDQVKNKRIFDDIQSYKNEIELAVGEAISWERLDAKRASRIALYHEGAITDEPEQLAQLRDWAAKTMIHFYDSIVKPASVALKAAR
jgi:hypothetical protein